MNTLTGNWKKILIISLLIAGLSIGVALVQRTQIFKSKADTPLSAGLNVYSPDGEVKYTGKDTQGIETFTTSSKNIRMNIKNLEELIKP